MTFKEIESTKIPGSDMNTLTSIPEMPHRAADLVYTDAYKCTVAQSCALFAPNVQA